MAGDARFTISAEDRTRRGTASVKRNLKGVEKGAASLTSSLGKMAIAYVGVASAMRAVGKATDFIKESIDLAAKQELAEKKLEIVRRRLGTATAEITAQNAAFASSLQVLTGVGDEAILEAQALLLTIGGISEEQLPAATKATLDWAAALGKDLNSAALDVAKALSGNVMMLQRYGVQIDKTEVETRGAIVVLEKLNEQFGGSAQARMETYAGKIDGLTGAWFDLKEVLGSGVTKSGTVLHALTVTTIIIERLNSAITVSGPAREKFIQFLKNIAQFGPLGGLRSLPGIIAGGMKARTVAETLAQPGVPFPGGDPATDQDLVSGLLNALGRGDGGGGKGGGKGPSGPGIRASIALTQEEEAYRASLVETQRAIDDRIAAQARLEAGLELTRNELVALRDVEDERAEFMEKMAARAADEERMRDNARLAQAQMFADQMASIMASAGALAGRALVAGLAGEKDAFKSVMRGLLGLAGAAFTLAVPGIGGALGGGILSGIGGLFHDGGIIRAHNGLAPGLRPGEVPIIAQTGESVLTRELTASIGADNIVDGNRRGSLSGDGVVNNYYTNGIDAKSLDDSLRRGSLGRSLAMSRRRGRVGRSS